MPSLTQLAAVAAGITGASAHLCTLNPLQRGGADGAQYAGNTTCLKPVGPCPPGNAGSPVAVYFAGQTVSFTLVKNLDHYNAPAPGNFTAYLWDSQGNSKLIAVAPDTPAPSMSLYQLTGAISTTQAPGQYVLQTIYASNNPQAPPGFFQCSDVVIQAPQPPSEEQLAEAYEHCKEHM